MINGIALHFHAWHPDPTSMRDNVYVDVVAGVYWRWQESRHPDDACDVVMDVGDGLVGWWTRFCMRRSSHLTRTASCHSSIV